MKKALIVMVIIVLVVLVAIKLFNDKYPSKSFQFISGGDQTAEQDIKSLEIKDIQNAPGAGFRKTSTPPSPQATENQ